MKRSSVFETVVLLILSLPRDITLVFALLPLSRRHSCHGNDGEFQLDRVARVSAGSRAPPARCPPGCVSVAVPDEHSLGSNAVTVAVLEGIESDDSKNLASVGMMTDLVEGMEGVRSALGVRRARTARETAR